MKRITLALIALTLLAWPALAALTNKDASVVNVSAKASAPVSIMGNWVDLVTAVNAADNGGNLVLNPGGITRAAQGRYNTLGAFTRVRARIKYTTGTTITACTLQPFGFDANGIPERLADDTGTYSLPFISDATNDVQDGTNSYTATQEFDARGCAQLLLAVRVLATGTGAATCTVQVFGY